VVTDSYLKERLNFACISRWEEDRESRGDEKAERGDRRGGGGGEAGGATSLVPRVCFSFLFFRSPSKSPLFSARVRLLASKQAYL
jgi:hypothetical protein